MVGFLVFFGFFSEVKNLRWLRRVRQRVNRPSQRELLQNEDISIAFFEHSFPITH